MTLLPTCLVEVPLDETALAENSGPGHSLVPGTLGKPVTEGPQRSVPEQDVLMDFGQQAGGTNDFTED